MKISWEMISDGTDCYVGREIMVRKNANGNGVDQRSAVDMELLSIVY